MRKLAFLLPAAILMAACNNDTGSTNQPQSIFSSNNSPSANNEPATNSASNTASNNAPAAANNAPDPTQDPNYNASRVFQLKDLKKITIKAPSGEMHLWVMDSPEKEREGMMFLQDREVKDNEGMIFVFKEVQKVKDNAAFWMHNTILALDIDYISKDKKVVNIGQGRPMNDDQVPPKGDYQFVIELKQGMSKKLGINAGTVLDIPSSIIPKS